MSGAKARIEKDNHTRDYRRVWVKGYWRKVKLNLRRLARAKKGR